MSVGRIRRCAFFTGVATIFAVACGTEGGDGSAVGQLDVGDCWSGPFDLAPDFFGASPYRETLQIRLQRGSDFETYSDHLLILVTDINAIRPAANGTGGKYNQELEVDLPPEVTPPGVPITPRKTPLLVNATLGLQRTCRTRNIPLQAVREVELQADGTCAAQVKKCDGTQTTTPTPVLGKSKMIFTHLPNGKIDEANAEERLVDGSFDLYFADPREACYPSPPPCRGHLSGRFNFYFSRGRPQQAFP